MERDLACVNKYYLKLNYNSHAHVERDKANLHSKTCKNITTHTLTWSVTLDVVYIWCLLNVMRTYCFI